MSENYAGFFKPQAPYIGVDLSKQDIPNANKNNEHIPEETTSDSKKEKMASVFNCAQVNVRTGPDRTNSILCVVPLGSQLLIEDITDGWAHVYLESGIEGYIMADYIKED